VNILDAIADKIIHQTGKEHRIFLSVVLGLLALALAGTTYVLYMQREADIEAINGLNEIIKKNDALMAKSERISAEEERIKALLDEHKGFSIKTFFESLTNEQKLKPEPGWDTEARAIEGNDAFDEIVLTAQFKGQTTQALVTLLGVLDNNPIVYVKEVAIKKEGSKTITFDLTIATKKRKSIWED